MPRLIDADANIETMKKCAENPENEQALLCYRYAQRILEEAPTVPAAPRWVRCEDELPDTPRMVIAYVDQWHIFAAYHSSRGEWKQADGFTVIGVTHWMPIEPPKED